MKIDFPNSLQSNLNSKFKAKIDLNIQVGRFFIKTISSVDELKLAFQLRFQVFQVEMIGHENKIGEDQDEFDLISDHLAVFDTKTQQMVATCRLNSSLFSNHFYSAQEFSCQELIQRPEVKLEIGRVCVHQEFRKGVIIMLLWRAIADYMMKSGAKILFGCGSVLTENANEALLVYRYIQEQGKVRNHLNIHPTDSYRSAEFELLLSKNSQKLTEVELEQARLLLPALCRSYFDIGCYSAGVPAYDREFKCYDFLTILESDELDPRVRQKMMGS